MASQNEVDTTNWYAKIKWADSNETEDVPVKDIRRFEPKHTNDFDRKHWYRVKGAAKYWTDGKKHSSYALIGYIAESLEELTSIKKRVIFPPFIPPPTQVPVSSGEEMDVRHSAGSSSSNSAITTQQAIAAARRENKRSCQEQAFEKFSQSFLTEKKNEILGKEGETQNLKKRIKELEKQLKNKETNKDVGQTTDLETRMEKKLDEFQNNFLMKVSQQMEAWKQDLQLSIDRQIKGGFDKMVQETTALYETMKTNTSNVPCTSSASSSLAVNSGDFVILSDKWGICCSKLCYEQMNQATKDADWANALLRGVFGSEAARYRVYPRNEENKRFPKEFLDTAKELFEAWLLKCGEENMEELKRSKAQLPAYLADIATNMVGSRSNKKRSLEGSEDGSPSSRRIQRTPKSSKTPTRARVSENIPRQRPEEATNCSAGPSTRPALTEVSLNESMQRFYQIPNVAREWFCRGGEEEEPNIAHYDSKNWRDSKHLEPTLPSAERNTQDAEILTSQPEETFLQI